MISLSCGISFGPKMFSGGISNVTRQYDGKRRSSPICFVVNVPSEPFMVWTPDLILRRSDAWPRGGVGIFRQPRFGTSGATSVTGRRLSGDAASVIHDDFFQPTCVHVENEASNRHIPRYPRMRPNFSDLRPSVFLR